MLENLKLGEKARIKDISGANQLVRRRLLDLGITEGSEVCVKCKMPFGGPFMLESCGQCVGIRRSEACCIKVERV
jgi:ferrous iron transport protein A